MIGSLALLAAALLAAASQATTFTYEAQGCASAAGAGCAGAADARNRLTGITYPAVAGIAASETFELDGNGNIEVHSRGGVVQVTASYDGLDRKTGETFSPVADDGITSIAYQHDGNGHLTRATETFTSGELKVSTWTWDHQDRLVARSDRHGRALSYAYDAQGNRTRRSGPEGATQYAYNARNQLTQVTPPGQGGIGIQPSGAGRLTGIAHGNGVTTTIEHDNAGRLTAIAHTAGGGTVASAHYGLDVRGNRITETITQGTQPRVTGYGYDNADRLTRITDPGCVKVGVALMRETGCRLTDRTRSTHAERLHRKLQRQVPR